MWEPLEIFTALLMQTMVQIRKKNTYFVTRLLFWNVGKSSFGALGVESPHGWAILMYESFHSSSWVSVNLATLCINIFTFITILKAFTISIISIIQFVECLGYFSSSFLVLFCESFLFLIFGLILWGFSLPHFGLNFVRFISSSFLEYFCEGFLFLILG